MKYKINDQIPDCEVFQLIDGNPKKFQINDFFKDNKSILLGMPGAFTSVCAQINTYQVIKKTLIRSDPKVLKKFFVSV